MQRTLGIHWIATTHGTWLHGDPRHSWQHGRLIGPDPFLQASIEKRMQHDAVILNPTEVLIVASVIGSVCKSHGHTVYTATFQSTHLHMVFAALSDDVKAVTARRKQGDARKHLWTQGHFSVFIDTEEHLFNAITYVREHNRRVGRQDDPYDWLTPLGTESR
ncbi:MAG: hypothetical protein ACF8OB_04345 [Phycisphaeraceae bacterium JB051]